MKKILSVLAIAALFSTFACETPEPAAGNPDRDSTVNNTTAQPDSSMNRPDSTQ